MRHHHHIARINDTYLCVDYVWPDNHYINCEPCGDNDCVYRQFDEASDG